MINYNLYKIFGQITARAQPLGVTMKVRLLGTSAGQRPTTEDSQTNSCTRPCASPSTCANSSNSHTPSEIYRFGNGYINPPLVVHNAFMPRSSLSGERCPASRSNISP
jgi:hypothetical protein